jgi:hypothetical protein
MRGKDYNCFSLSPASTLYDGTFFKTLGDPDKEE